MTDIERLVANEAYIARRDTIGEVAKVMNRAAKLAMDGKGAVAMLSYINAELNKMFNQGVSHERFRIH
jgi:hypothetical protein